MTADQRTTFLAEFAGEQRAFHIGAAERYELETGAAWHSSAPIRRLNELCARAENPSRARGPLQQLFARLRGDAWAIADIAEPIRLGLIGGGMDRAEAEAVVNQHVLNAPLLVPRQIAISVLGVVLVGKQESMSGEPEAA